MKANELMIGDWVVGSSGEPFKIGIIDPDFLFWNEVQPIPLTPKILEKNGFVANNHICPYPYYEYVNKEHKLEIGFGFPQGNQTIFKEPWVYIDSECVFIQHLPCIHVHQLQHALRLCGIEKEIIL